MPSALLLLSEPQLYVPVQVALHFCTPSRYICIVAPLPFGRVANI
jgi:hypothetical protein